MPDWRDELETLLAQLHVSLDLSEGRAEDALAEGEAEAADAHVAQQPRGRANGAARARKMAPVGQAEVGEGDDEVSAVREEIEATVGKVVALARAGRMDTALRDDVVFVLRALIRPLPMAGVGSKTQGATVEGVSLGGRQRAARRPNAAEVAHEWQLGSAAAVLRFCRLVLRLTRALSHEAEV